MWTVVARALGVRLSELRLRLLQTLEADQLKEWSDASKTKK